MSFLSESGAGNYGGLTPPVFSGNDAAFAIACVQCGNHIATLRAREVPTMARVFLKTVFNKQAKQEDMPEFRCPACDKLHTEGSPK